MLSEVKDALLDLENFSLLELISILQKFASDPSINTNQAGLVLILLIMSWKKRLLGTTKRLWYHISLGIYGFPNY